MFYFFNLFILIFLDYDSYLFMCHGKLSYNDNKFSIYY